MNTDLEDTTPSEVALGRLTAGVARLLEREMDSIFQDLLRGAWHAPESPVFRHAQLANRIVVLCRNCNASLSIEGFRGAPLRLIR